VFSGLLRLGGPAVGGATGVIIDPNGGHMLVTGSFYPGSMADAAAPNMTLYYSTTQGKLAFKDGSGVVQNLY
jgi:hypothetical protein